MLVVAVGYEANRLDKWHDGESLPGENSGCNVILGAADTRFHEDE
jgi:hypothetical protein